MACLKNFKQSCLCVKNKGQLLRILNVSKRFYIIKLQITGKLTQFLVVYDCNSINNTLGLLSPTYIQVSRTSYF